MNFEQVYQIYNEDYKKSQDAFQDWNRIRDTVSYDKFTGFKMDYGKIEKLIIEAAKEEFGFTDKQLGYIYSKVYEDKHSSFGDCIYGMKEYCQFIKDFPKN